MKNYFFLPLFVFQFFLAANTLAQSSKNQLPPLIDREIFFDDPEISGGQLSPDGKYLSFIKKFKGTRNIWVKLTGEPFEKARPLTDDTNRPIRQYFWSRDGKYILYAQDKGGNENYHIYAVDPSEKLKKGKEVPEARALTAGENVRALIYDVPKKYPDLIYVGLNERDPAWHDLYSIKISTGEKKLIRENKERISGWEFDLDGNLKLVVINPEIGGTDIMKIDGDSLIKIYSCNVFETCYPFKFSKDPNYFYMVTNKGEQLDLSIMTKFNLASNSMEVVDQDPLKKVDFGGAVFSELNDKLVGTYYDDDKTRFYWTDKTYQEAYAFLSKEFPGKEIHITSKTANEQLWLVSVTSDVEPGAAYLFDLTAKKATLQYRPRPKLNTEYLAEMKVIKYRSSDGLEIPAYLTLPKGVVPQNLPLVVMPHGGPWARDFWGYNPYAQFFANRGYAVLQPNFRGSTGYGKKFLNAGNKEWGWLMQDDLTAGVDALSQEGTIDYRKVAIFGGSYGGYATLAGLTFTPDVYACGVSFVGPSNLVTLLNSIPPYWESFKKIMFERLGNPNKPDGLAQLKKQSPLFSANNIKVPLLVVQGANDPRVKKAESDQIVVACRELNLPVEYIVADDEGHGFARPVNNMAFVAAMEKFLAKHIGGRYQESMTGEVGKRLKEITVDVASAELPKEMEATTLFLPPPTPDRDLTSETSHYKVTFEMANQKFDMELETKVEDAGEHWIVTDKLNSFMGEMTDQVKVLKKSLTPVERKVDQAGITMNFEYDKKSVKGAISGMGQKEEIAEELPGLLFADGAGAKNIIACLPLKKGYNTTFRNFDSQKKVVNVYALEVTGEEEITVPAGTFSTLKVEIKPANGDPGKRTVWVTNDQKRIVVKASAIMPEANGAVMTSELK